MCYADAMNLNTNKPIHPQANDDCLWNLAPSSGCLKIGRYYALAGMALALLSACAAPTAQHRNDGTWLTKSVAGPVRGSVTSGNKALVPPLFGIATICPVAQGSAVVWVHVHENETTAWQVAQQVLAAHPTGCLYGLQHGGSRNVVVNRGGERYQFDPNRMFTASGRQHNIVVFHGDAMQIRNQVAMAADDFFQRYLAQAKLIVAVHNNRIGGLNIHNYAVGGSLAANVAEVNINPIADADDFFYVTSAKTYAFLAARGFNVVLQNAATVVDDGSLSVRAAHERIEYINAEAGMGHWAAQTDMLKAVAAYIQQQYHQP